jgi:hypothetical protein
MGLKRLGGVQTALIGLSELFVTVLSTFLLLGEKLAAAQWPGTALLEGSVLLVACESRLGTLPTPRSWTPLVHGKWAAPTGGLLCQLRLPAPRRPSKLRTPSAQPSPLRICHNCRGPDAWRPARAIAPKLRDGSNAARVAPIMGAVGGDDLA